jgi:hypothetical protein
MSKFNNVSLGYDPEFFLALKSNKDELYPSIGLFGGTKTEKVPLNRLGEGFGIEEDNVAVELTAPPAYTKEDFRENMIKMIQHLHEDLIPNLKGVPDLVLSRKASGIFLEKYLQSDKAKAFGCSPEINAYTGHTFTCSAKSAGNFRCCGGHVHIGYEGDHSDDTKLALGRALDLYLGLPSLFLDNDTERRKLYGKAGSIRMTPYGIEYRVLSNFWVFDPQLMDWVYDQVLLSIENIDMFSEDNDSFYGAIRYAIDKNEKELASEILNSSGVVLPELVPALV